MSIDVFYLWNPELPQLVTFKISSGSGKKPDWDYVEITWTGEDGLPCFGLEDYDRFDTDRLFAQDICRKLETKGYQRHLGSPVEGVNIATILTNLGSY